MLFNSIEYVIFLPLFFIGYWFIFKRLKLQNIFVVISSYIFYGWWDWRFLILIAFTTLCSYASGILIERQERRLIQRWICAANITLNLLVLCIFKYFNFFSENFVSLFETFGIKLDWVTLDILLPVGISFYTFQALSYTIDIYQHKMKPTHDMVAFFAFISFFPQLVAGPIERATNLLPQFLKVRTFDYGQAVDGMQQILYGLFKKMVIADNCSRLVDIVFSNYQQLGSIQLFLGAVFFTFQIYCDFSGYSDIAIGTAKLLGIKLMKNFDYPYISRNIAEFWRRWHMTLGSWFRDYVYIPMGGNRKGVPWLLLNLCVVWLLTGLWHGSGVNFLIWGITVGLFVIVEKLFYGKWLSRHKLVSHIYVWIVIPLTWVIFAVTSLPDLGIYFGRLFPFFGIGETLNPQDIFKYFSMYWWLLLAGIFFCIPGVSAWFNKHRKSWYANALLLVLFWMAVYQLTNAANNPFMYFRF